MSAPFHESWPAVRSAVGACRPPILALRHPGLTISKVDVLRRRSFVQLTWQGIAPFPLLLVLGCGGNGFEPGPPGPEPVAVVVVSPATLNVPSGQTGTLTAEPRDAAGAPLTGRPITWNSSDPAIATVSAQGVVSGLAVGTATVTATAEGKAGTAQVVVTPGAVATVTIAPLAAPIPVGEKVQLVPIAKDAHGNTVTGRPVTWASSDRVVATVSTTGEVSALAVGGCSVTATIDGIVGGTAVQVRFGALQIHQINVGWGGSVLVRGPDGTTILLEAGDTGEGTAEVVPYLKSVGLQPSGGLSYTIAGHQHCDHLGGLDEVVQGGYDVRLKNYFNGSLTTSSCVEGWQAASATTTAGLHVVPAVGSAIQLGNGAKVTVVAVNGQIIGGGSVTVSDENDRSIGLLIQYGGFDYIWASDMGGGDSDNACTGRSTSQKNVESSLIKAISPGGAAPQITAGGIDVLVVNHHGSESSTNAEFMNLTQPAVALIGVGTGQSTNFQLPRRSVVESVLLAQAAACVTAPPALVLQSEEGSPIGAETSFAGFSVGDIVVTSDGGMQYTVAANGQVTGGPIEVLLAGLPRVFSVDDPPATPLGRSSVRRPIEPAHWPTR